MSQFFASFEKIKSRINKNEVNSSTDYMYGITWSCLRFSMPIQHPYFSFHCPLWQLHEFLHWHAVKKLPANEISRSSKRKYLALQTIIRYVLQLSTCGWSGRVTSDHITAAPADPDLNSICTHSIGPQPPPCWLYTTPARSNLHRRFMWLA